MMATRVASSIATSTDQSNAPGKKQNPSFRDIVSLIVPGNREKALQQAITNAIAILLVVVILAAFVAIHIVLTPFLRPLVWALLFGSVLHPLKRSLSLSTQQWLDELKDTEMPITFGILLLPFGLVNSFISRLAKSLRQYKNILLVNFILLPTTYILLTRYGDAEQLYSLITKCYLTIIYSLPEFIEQNNQPWITMTLVVASAGHLALVVTLPWNNRTKIYLKWSILLVFVIMSIQLLLINITFGIILVSIVFILVLTGLLTHDDRPITTTQTLHDAQYAKTPLKVADAEFKTSKNVAQSITKLNNAFVDSCTTKRGIAIGTNDSPLTFNLRNRVSRNFSSLVQSFLNTTGEESQNVERNEDQDTECAGIFDIDEDQDANEQKDKQDVYSTKSRRNNMKKASNWAKTPISTSTPIQTTLLDNTNVHESTSKSNSDMKLSDAYLYGLIWVFVLCQFWFHPKIAYVVVPIISIILVVSWSFNKIRERIFNKSQPEKSWIDVKIFSWFDTRQDVLIHPGLRTTYKYLVTGDRTLFIRPLEGYVDAVSSACVIFLMVVIVLFTTLFLSFQIYAESVYLIERLSHSINSILINNPDLKQLLPENSTGVNSLLDDAVNNTYIHGREWIKTSTRQLLNNAAMENFNKTQSKIIERQMVEFWDRAYILWLRRRDNGTGAATVEFDQIPYDWNRLFDALQSLNFTLCYQILKQNIDTLVSVAESILSVLRGNLNLVLGAITAALSVVVVGGNALVNFIINLVSTMSGCFCWFLSFQHLFRLSKSIKKFPILNLLLKNRSSLQQRCFTYCALVEKTTSHCNL